LAFRCGFERDREAVDEKVGCSAVAFFSGWAYGDTWIQPSVSFRVPPSTLRDAVE
jgi:hypothetical protein